MKLKSKLLLLRTFVSFCKLLSRFRFRIVAMVKNFARKIGARATRIYAFAHARAFERDAWRSRQISKTVVTLVLWKAFHK